jgi:hypothetical protein
VHHLNEIVSDESLMQLFKMEGPIEKYPNLKLIVPSPEKKG